MLMSLFTCGEIKGSVIYWEQSKYGSLTHNKTALTMGNGGCFGSER